MQKRKSKNKKYLKTSESKFFLKITILLLLGCFWVRLSGDTFNLALPLGFIIGLIITQKDYFKSDRKIQYVVLLLSMFISFWTPLGLIINL